MVLLVTCAHWVHSNDWTPQTQFRPYSCFLTSALARQMKKQALAYESLNIARKENFVNVGDF